MFKRQFEEGAADSPGSRLIGSSPVSIEDYEVVAIAEGLPGFRRGAGPASTRWSESFAQRLTATKRVRH